MYDIEEILKIIVSDIKGIGADLLDCRDGNEVSLKMYAIYENRVPEDLQEAAMEHTGCRDMDDMSNLIYLFGEDGLIQIRDAQYLSMENAK